MHRCFCLSIAAFLCGVSALYGMPQGQDDPIEITPSVSEEIASESPVVIDKDKEKTAPTKEHAAVHPSTGTEIAVSKDIHIKLEKKLQNYGGSSERDPDILSPKSVRIHPSGKKFYVNSLEGAKTVVYSLPDLKKLAVINHRFNNSNAGLWAPPSGLFKFRHYKENLNTFSGKPVESTLSHKGRYLWVPYYRRSYDLNAQDPSALAVIDTSCDSIIRVMEAGVLPKMITTSPDGSLIAVTHWGDNTVGFIDISSEKPEDWKYKSNIAVGKQLIHNFSLTEPVDRDSNTGEALRGTVFTPDGKYLLVGCMGGSGGIAVIDVDQQKYLGKITGLMPNVRHLAIKGNWLYASINTAGYVERAPLSDILNAIKNRAEKHSMHVSNWQKVKTAPGTRTISLSPRGDYIFAACNIQSVISVVDSTMQKLAEIPVDSYPVGLDISPDGQWLISTSQGRKGLGGGNCVDVYRITGLLPEENINTQEVMASDSDDKSAAATSSTADTGSTVNMKPVIWIGAGVLILIIIFLIIRLSRKNRS